SLEQVVLAVDSRVATLTLNNPDQRNPLSAAMLRDLAAAFRWCKDEPEVRVAVLTGAGRVFCAGADLSSFDGEMTGLEKFRSRDLFVDLFILMAELGKPIVGRINGHALAGGFGLACSSRRPRTRAKASRLSSRSASRTSKANERPIPRAPREGAEGRHALPPQAARAEQAHRARTPRPAARRRLLRRGRPLRKRDRGR